MENAKNDKTVLLRGRLRTKRRFRLARLIFALSLTTCGVFFTGQARSQTSNDWRSSAYLQNANSNADVGVVMDDQIARANMSKSASSGRSSVYSNAAPRPSVYSNSVPQAAVVSNQIAKPSAVAGSTPQAAVVSSPAPQASAGSPAPLTFVGSNAPSYSIPQGKFSANANRNDAANRRVGAVPTAIPRAASNASRVGVGVRPGATPGDVPARDAQIAPKQLQEAAASLQGARRLETLEEATRIALAESRTQRALALKKGASRSTVDAARALANPKITNATSYVGLANRPTLETSVDLSGSLGGLGSVAPGISEALAGVPMQFTTDSVLADREFATSVTAVTLPLYLGGRVRALTREAEALTSAIEAGEDVGEQNVKSQVTEAYFLVLRTRKLHEVAVEGTKTTQAHLEDATRALNVGVVTRNVVLAAQVANEEAKQLELRVANAQNLAEAAYNRVLWRPLDSQVAIADVEPGAPLGQLDALTSQAVRTRAELRVLQNESRAMREQENVARADVLPQVAVVGAYAYQENEALKDNSNGVAAVGMVWTPFDGGTSRARQSAARQNAMAITRAREEAESGVRLQVRQAWLAEQEARERMEVARVAVEHAEENLRVVTRGFQEGLVNHTEALDASTMLTTAKSNYANAKYDAILATQRLRRAVGIL